MSVIKGEKKIREPKWYETPTGKLRLKMIVFASRLPWIGPGIRKKYSHLPGVVTK